MHPQLNSEYSGECRKGLADGKGEAIGVDHYIGWFKKGVPHGQGIYEWSTGEKHEGFWKNGLRQGAGTYYFFTKTGKDTLISGKWVKDEYVEEKTNDPDYKVTNKRSINRVSFIRQGEGNEIRVKIFSKGSETMPDDLMILGDSGNTRTEGRSRIFEGISFPFEGRITFTGISAIGTSTTDCLLDFKVYKPGRYELYIYVL